MTATTVALIVALSNLDPGKDEHWTQSGLPALPALQEMLGDKTLKRADVEEHAPEFTRSNRQLAGGESPIVPLPADPPKADVSENPEAVASMVSQAFEQELGVKLREIEEKREEHVDSLAETAVEGIPVARPDLAFLTEEQKVAALRAELEQLEPAVAKLRKEKAMLDGVIAKQKDVVAAHNRAMQAARGRSALDRAYAAGGSQIRRPEYPPIPNRKAGQ